MKEPSPHICIPSEFKTLYGTAAEALVVSHLVSIVYICTALFSVKQWSTFCPLNADRGFNLKGTGPQWNRCGPMANRGDDLDNDTSVLRRKAAEDTVRAISFHKRIQISSICEHKYWLLFSICHFSFIERGLYHRLLFCKSRSFFRWIGSSCLHGNSLAFFWSIYHGLSCHSPWLPAKWAGWRF